MKLAEPTTNQVKRKPPISSLGSPTVCKILSRSSTSFSAGVVTSALIARSGAAGGAAGAGVTVVGDTEAGATEAGGTGAGVAAAGGTAAGGAPAGPRRGAGGARAR